MKKVTKQQPPTQTPTEEKSGVFVGFMSKLAKAITPKKDNQKQPSNSTGITRRKFLAGMAATAVVAGVSSLPTEAIAKAISTPKKDPKYDVLRSTMQASGEAKGVELLGENAEDIQKLAQAVEHMDNLQKNFQQKLGVKYKEASRVLNSYKEANAPLVAYNKLSEQYNGATAMFTDGAGGDKPFVLLDSKNALDGDKNNTAQNAFHEMLHMEQFVTKTHLLKEPGYSKNNIKENMLEMEGITNAKEYELCALNSMITIQEQKGMVAPLKETELKFIAKKTKEIYIDQAKNTNDPIAQYGIASTVAALDTIEKNGAKAIENGLTVKAAYEVLRGDNKYAKAFEKSYEGHANNAIKSYAANIDPNVHSNPDKDISDIVAKRWELDSRESLANLAPVMEKPAQALETAIEKPKEIAKEITQGFLNAPTGRG